MKLIKRSLIAGALVASTLGMTVATASASVSGPATVVGASGSFTTRTALGTSSCALAVTAGSLTGVTGGATGTITGATFSGCSGLITRATILGTTISAVNGVTTITTGLLIVNAFGGQCLYQGTLTGTWTSPATTLTASNSSIRLFRNLNGGICSDPADANLSVRLPSGTSIVNP